MKKNLLAVIGAAVIAAALFSGNVNAAEASAEATATTEATSSASAAAGQFDGQGMRPGGGMRGKGQPGGMPFEMTEEEKTRFEAERAEREEAINAFVASLTAEQKAIFEELFARPERPFNAPETTEAAESAAEGN